MKTGVGGGDGEGVRDFCFSMWHSGGMVGVNERMSSPPPTITWLKCIKKEGGGMAGDCVNKGFMKRRIKCVK